MGLVKHKDPLSLYSLYRYGLVVRQMRLEKHLEVRWIRIHEPGTSARSIVISPIIIVRYMICAFLACDARTISRYVCGHAAFSCGGKSDEAASGRAGISIKV